MNDISPQKITLLKANDVGSGAPQLIADDIITAAIEVNLLDLAMDIKLLGYLSVDYTDLIADGGMVRSLVIRATQSAPDGTMCVEDFAGEATRKGWTFTTRDDALNPGDRVASIRSTLAINSDAPTAEGRHSRILSRFSGDIFLNVTFDATLNVKTGTAIGRGSVIAEVPNVDSRDAHNLEQITFQIIGWKPELFFTRKQKKLPLVSVGGKIDVSTWSNTGLLAYAVIEALKTKTLQQLMTLDDAFVTETVEPLVGKALTDILNYAFGNESRFIFMYDTVNLEKIDHPEVDMNDASTLLLELGLSEDELLGGEPPVWAFSLNKMVDRMVNLNGQLGCAERQKHSEYLGKIRDALRDASSKIDAQIKNNA